MAEGLNRVMLLGGLCADPELRYTQGGQAVLHIRLATTESYFDKKENKRVERTDFHAVVVWGKRGEALGKILRKGSQVYCEGPMRTSSYDDRDGNKRYRTECIANQVILAGGGKRDAAPSGDDDGFGDPPPERGGYQRDRPPRGVAPAAPPPDDFAGGGGGDGGYGDDTIPFLRIGALPETDGIPRTWI